MGGSRKWSRRLHITQHGFRAGARPAPDVWGRDGDSSSSASESHLSSPWGSVLSLVSAQSLQASRVARGKVGDTSSCGHHSLDPVCLSSYGRCCAAPHIQIRFSKSSLGAPSVASSPGVYRCEHLLTSLPGWYQFSTTSLKCPINLSWLCIMHLLGGGSHMCIHLSMSVWWHFFCCPELLSESNFSHFCRIPISSMESLCRVLNGAPWLDLGLIGWS